MASAAGSGTISTVTSEGVSATATGSSATSVVTTGSRMASAAGSAISSTVISGAGLSPTVMGSQSVILVWDMSGSAISITGAGTSALTSTAGAGSTTSCSATTGAASFLLITGSAVANLSRAGFLSALMKRSAGSVTAILGFFSTWFTGSSATGLSRALDTTMGAASSSSSK